MSRERSMLIRNLENIFNHPSDQEYKQKLYEHLVDSNWWSDDKMVNDVERKKFLYEEFMKYYDIAINGEVNETEVYRKESELRFTLINQCKIQLDKELNRVNIKDYERIEE